MEPCTHELMQWFDVANNAYRWQCKPCGKSLNIYYYAAISRTRKEWREYLINEVTLYFGAEWGKKAREWLERTEELQERTYIYEPAKPDTTA